jgi:hypothetical protein
MTSVASENSANAAANINGFSTEEGTGKCYFRPALFWQVVREFHIVDAGLEFRMNFESKVNEARFPSSLDLESNPAQLAVAKERATSIVQDKDGREDFRLLSMKLRNFCTWGKEEEVKNIIRTCYVTKDVAVPALHEACRFGFLNIVKLLVSAKTPASAFGTQSAKNCLHIACENGHEEIAKFLIVHGFSSQAGVMAETNVTNGLSPFAILRQNDMGMMAKRLETLMKETFPTSKE